MFSHLRLIHVLAVSMEKKNLYTGFEMLSNQKRKTEIS